MGVLAVPGARLSYEVRGNGPLLLLIPGASGTVHGGPVVAELAKSSTVVTYDRRGFSRSHLDGAQDYARRLETDADDVRRLIEHLGDEPATIVGASSGAIVALDVLARHPAVVRTLVPHEPPAMKLLPDGQTWLAFFSEVYDHYRRSGPGPALAAFRERTFAASDRLAMARAGAGRDGEPILVNATYWFERELRQYPPVDLDLDALADHADRIVPVAGRDSRGYPCYQVTAALGKRLGRELVELPGGHVGFVTHPDEFARALLAVLARTGRGSGA